MQEKKPAKFISIPVLIPVAALKAAIRRFNAATGDEKTVVVPVVAQVPASEVTQVAPAPVVTAPAAPAKPKVKPLSERAKRVLRIIEHLTKFRGRFGASRAEVRAQFPMSDGQWTQVIVELKARNLIRAVRLGSPKECRDCTWLPVNKKPVGKQLKAKNSKRAPRPAKKSKAPNLKVHVGGAATPPAPEAQPSDQQKELFPAGQH